KSAWEPSTRTGRMKAKGPSSRASPSMMLSCKTAGEGPAEPFRMVIGRHYTAGIEAMARLSVRVQPGASKDEILRWDNSVLHLRVTAPPIEGRANAAVIDVLSGFLRVPKSSLSILRGGRVRQKAVEIEGMTDAELAAVMERALVRGPRRLEAF